MGFQVDKPLFLLLLVPVLFVLYLYWKKNKTTALFEKRVIISLRFLVFLLLILALSIPQILYPVKGITTVFVVDTSESVKNQEDAMFAALEQAINVMDIDDEYAIVTVAEDAEIRQSLSKRDEGINTNEMSEKRSYTNLQDGLQLARSLLTNEQNGRIVLMSDGNENIGNVKQQVKILRDQQISVDVIPFQPSINEDVSIKRFAVPPNAYVGEHAKLSLTLASTSDTTSRIRITENNEAIVDEKIQVKTGQNSYSFHHLINSAGFHTFKAEMISEGDAITQNNQSFALTNAKGAPTVLLVEGSKGEGENIYTALKASGLNIKGVVPALLPTALEGFLQYESIIFSNVSATDITGAQMEMIETAVKDFGTGFVMTGGNKSYGLGGYFKTPIEKLLPVEMDLKGKREMPSLGMIIVMDRSGSMGGYKLDLAKEAAARSVELLREKDTLGFIAFDDRPWEIIELGPLKDKKEAADKIRSITEGGGTEIFTPLAKAYAQLEPLKLKRKHIILLTDGQSASNGNYTELIAGGLKNNVTLSTVAIGSDADRALLEQLATEGTGRFYDVQDASTIPSILSRETVLSTRTYIEDNPFYPKYFNGYNWSPLFQDGVPKMNAYVATDPKSRAETILMSEKEDPVLIRWKYGLGKSIAWTSDVSGAWSGGWPAWNNWSKLWNEIITWTLPTYQNEAHEISKKIEGKNVILTATSKSEGLLPIEATVVDEKGEKLDAAFRTIAPGKYEISFPADTGIYFLQLAKKDGEDVISTFKTGIVVPYSKEFEFQNQNDTLLKDIAEQSGGKILTEPKEAFRDIKTEKYEKQPIFTPLLVLAFFLLFIEIAIRRFGLTPVVEKIQHRRTKKVEVSVMKKKETEQTFTQLKKAVSRPAKQTTIKIKEKISNESFQKPQPKEASHQQNEQNDRLKRLLDAKKRSGR